MSVRILEGDCLSVMPTLDADSIDAVICDPPYGLKFMGKEWDHGVPGVPFWEAAKRVAKPGAYLLAFGGTRTHHRLTVAIEDAGWEIRDCLMWLHGQGFPKGKAQLKPAWEPIIMARKKGPLSPLNIDGCRIGTSGGGGNGLGSHFTGGATIPRVRHGEDRTMASGRWPANLILDESSAAMLDEQTGVSQSTDRPRKRQVMTSRGVPGGAYGNPAKIDYGHDGFTAGYSDTGGASRFFYTAKASRSEREAGLDGFPLTQRGTLNEYARPSEGRTANKASGGPSQNGHPTVKPLDLMQWLCRLVTPKGGLILDPFCGSGTTGRAAVAEGFSFIGIEKDVAYAEIARARIAEYAPLFGDVA